MADRYYGVTVAVHIDADPEKVRLVKSPYFRIYLDYGAKPGDKVTRVDAVAVDAVRDDSDYADYAIEKLLNQFQSLGDTNGLVIFDIPCSHDYTNFEHIEHGRVI